VLFSGERQELLDSGSINLEKFQSPIHRMIPAYRISQPLAARLKLPQSVVLAAVGIGIGALPAFTAQSGLSGPMDAATDLFAKFTDSPGRCQSRGPCRQV
jgi:hypothetical protein